MFAQRNIHGIKKLFREENFGNVYTLVVVFKGGLGTLTFGSLF